MSNLSPSSLHSIIPVEPLAVKPKIACAMLSVGENTLYDLIKRGELDSFVDKGRRITTESIRAYIERKVAQGVTIGRGGPGRPKKTETP
jgi:Helix-turn-helix domain